MRDLDLIRSYRSDVDGDNAARAAARKTLRDHMEAAPAARRRVGKPARRLGWSLAILLVATSGAAAAGLVLTSDDVSLGSVACLDSTRTIDEPGSSVFVEPSHDPVAACARVWRAGEIGDRRGATPELVACASAGQPIVVVPGGPGTCAELRLEPLPGDYAASASAFGRAKGILTRDWDLNRPRSACEHPATALRHARNLLRDANVGGASVELAGDGPCAGPPSFSDGGAVVRLETVSREQAADRYEIRIRTALAPLSAQVDCEDPQRVAARARRLLAAAGVAHVSVRVENQGRSCFDPGGYELAPGTVILQAGGQRWGGQR
jgi:hypothetical protein